MLLEISQMYMNIETDLKLDFSDVLIKPKRSTLVSREDVDLTRSFTLLHSERQFTGIPIIVANMDTTGSIKMKRAVEEYQLTAAFHKFYSAGELTKYFKSEKTPCFPAIYTMGISEAELDKFNKVSATVPVDFVCIDVANGYTQRFIDFVKKFRDDNTDVGIMAGNVVTAEMTEQLILSGADIVKVGIGSGAVCETRIKAGVGIPQLSAVIECADAAHGLNGLICSDGGCTVPGDIAKAFAAGADFVMSGGMFAGHLESPGEVRVVDGNWYKEFYGMSSTAAMTKHYGKKDSYRSSEGKRVLIPYRGKVKDTIEDILGGLRSTCTYVGASKLKELSKRTTFVQVNNQSNQVFNHLSGIVE